MIEKIENISQFNEYDLIDIYSIRILSLAKSYGCNYSFARFYRQLNDDNNVTAILSFLDRDVTLSFKNEADKDEIIEFLDVIGFDTLLCDDSFDLSIDYEDGCVMSFDKKDNIDCQYYEINCYSELLKLYNFINHSDNNFDDWYVDINHRIRHKTSKAIATKIDDKIISSAILSSIYNDSAILTGVETDENYRRKGYASNLVSSICNEVNGKVYLMREKNKNESFYKKLGFKNIGKWRIYK